MVRSVLNVAVYTKMHLRHMVLISIRKTMSGNPLVLKVPDFAAFTLYAVNMFLSLLSYNSK